jgi:mercuric ion transport protein
MGRGQVTNLGAGGLPASGQIQQSADLVEFEAQLPCPAHKAQPAYVLRAIAPIPSASRRRGDQPDPFVVADRLDVAAGAARKFADLESVISHVRLGLGLESVVTTDGMLVGVGPGGDRMTVRNGPGARPGGRDERPAETALTWAALATAAGAVFAWAACCILPMSLALAGLGLGGLGWVAGQRSWITILAIAAIGAGWVMTWRRARTCRTDGSCAAPSKLQVSLLGAATLLLGLALIWRPIIEPWALALIRNARG